MPPIPPPPQSRTSSAISTVTASILRSRPRGVDVDNLSKPGPQRSRKRFSQVQLVMLENLFHEKPHPTYPEREALAKAGGMEVKSITIWFQNKRQIKRKVSSQPSLDDVASRLERQVPALHTPSGRYDPKTKLWEQMPSSPLAPPSTRPPAPEYVEFGKIRPMCTLAWACAAARLAEKEGRVQRDEFGEVRTQMWEGARGDTEWTRPRETGGCMTVLHKGTWDEDMVEAAVALCDLSRGKYI